MKENNLLARFTSAQKTLELRAALTPGSSDGPFSGREILAGVRPCIRSSQNILCPEIVLPIAELKKALSVAEFNLGNTALDSSELVKSYSQLQLLMGYSVTMLQTVMMGIDTVQRITGGMVTGKVERDKLPLLIGTSAQEMRKTCMEFLSEDGDAPARLALPVYKDWMTNRENVGPTDSAGFVKVSGVRIDRAQYRTNETGEEKMDAPWLIKVYTFDAPAAGQSYDTIGVRNMIQEQLALTDSQMFSLCERVLRIDEAFTLLQLGKE